jgi:hypothetical protein
MSTRKEKKPRDYGEPIWESEKYAVYSELKHVLFVAKDAEVPDVLKRDSKAPDQKGRKAYVYKHKFTAEDNDCLQFAESLAAGIVHYSSEACVYRVQGSRRQFGATDVQNIKLAQEFKQVEIAVNRGA